MRQGFHDDARGKRQHLFGSDIQLARQRNTTSVSPAQTVIAGARVGVTSVDKHGANAVALPRVFGQMLTTDLHRSGAKTVLCEHGAHRGAFVEQQHGQILAVGLADARLGDSPAHTRNGVKVSGGGGNQIDGHAKTPAVQDKGRE